MSQELMPIRGRGWLWFLGITLIILGVSMGSINGELKKEVQPTSESLEKQKREEAGRIAKQRQEEYQTFQKNREKSERLIAKPKIIAQDDFETGTLQGGFGWRESQWVGEGYAGVKPSSKAKQGNYIAILWGRREGSYIMRSVDLSSAIKPRLQFWGKSVQFWFNALNPEEEDYAVVLVSQDKKKWHPIATWTANDYGSGDTKPYRFVDIDLSSYVGTPQLWIKCIVVYKSFQMIGDYPMLYIDDLKIVDVGLATIPASENQLK